MIVNLPSDGFINAIIDWFFGIRHIIIKLSFLSIKFKWSKRVYIYGLRTKRTKTFRYIGQTNSPQKRLMQHISRAKSKTHRNKLLSKWILKHENEIVMDMLLITCRDKASEDERRLIKFYTKKNHRLFNIKMRVL